jgi:hypothetical protein
LFYFILLMLFIAYRNFGIQWWRAKAYDEHHKKGKGKGKGKGGRGGRGGVKVVKEGMEEEVVVEVAQEEAENVAAEEVEVADAGGWM